MDSIHMFWHKVPFGKKNFGDVLGPYIVERISGKKPLYTPLLHTGFNKKFILTYLRAFYNRKLSFRETWYNIQFLFGKKQRLLITIGSIIDWYTNPNCDIWGAGIMFRNSQVANAHFYAVRGKYSQLRLSELGYKVPEVIGDPALLTPLVYTPSSEKKYTLGIIPHYLHYDESIAKLDYDKILVINLLDPIEKVIEDVNSCDKVISSSLHGIIIAHAYGIPALWFDLSKADIGGDDIKFADYFSSVALNEYNFFKIEGDTYNEQYSSMVHQLFMENRQLTIVDSEKLSQLQKDLISSAPFSILPQFRNTKS